MPAHLVLHKGDALALDGVGQDTLGHTGNGGCTEGRLNGVQIVAVNLMNIQAEGPQLGGQVAQST